MADIGTYASNAVASGNTNGLLSIMDNYDKVKEFFSINLDAFITAATLNYFGMDNVTSAPNCFPPNIKSASKTEKRQWLHEQVSKMLDKFVMDSFCDLQSIHENLSSSHPPPQSGIICRHAGCNMRFTYLKCLLKHEINKHNLHLDSPGQKRMCKLCNLTN